MLGFRVEGVGALRFRLSFVLGFRGFGGLGFRALSLRVLGLVVFGVWGFSFGVS